MGTLWHSMGFELEKRSTFLNTRNKFIAYLQGPPPPIPPPPPPPMEMLGMHTLAAMAAAAPPQQAPPQHGFTVDEAYAAILAMEVNGELAVLADLAAAL